MKILYPRATYIHTAQVWRAKGNSHLVLQIQRHLLLLGHPAHRSNRARERCLHLAISSHLCTSSRCLNQIRRAGRTNDCRLSSRSIPQRNTSTSKERRCYMTQNHSASCLRRHLTNRHHTNILPPPRKYQHPQDTDLPCLLMEWANIGNQYQTSGADARASASLSKRRTWVDLLPAQLPAIWAGLNGTVKRSISLSSPRPSRFRNFLVSLFSFCFYLWGLVKLMSLSRRYYELVHPTFPLLPHSKDRLHQRLASASPPIREAFLETLYASVRSNPSSNLRGSSPLASTKKACELMLASQFGNPAVRTMPTNLLYLQAMILLSLEADNHGPATMLGHGPPRAAWLGAAAGLALYLRLHRNRNRSREKSTNGDPDSDEGLARRAWLVLVVLDRWHAISTSSPPLIPDSSVALGPEDQPLLGSVPFHITRKSDIPSRKPQDS